MPGLAVLAVEEVAHGLAAGCVGSAVGGAGGVRGFGFGVAALGAAVGKAGLAGFQLELFVADDADFDGEGHFAFKGSTTGGRFARAAAVRGLFVGDDFAEIGDVFLDASDFFGPVAVGVVGVGDAGGVLALGLGEMVEEDVEAVLEGGAGHVWRLSLWGVGG